MPELLEVELYRQMAERVLGRRVARVRAPDAWFLKGGLSAKDAGVLRGHRFTAARRIGKQLLLDTDDGPVLGLHFGMSGRLLVDRTPAIERLEYSSPRDVTAWDRFTIEFDDGGDLRVRDPRRLGGVALDLNESKLGIDATLLTLAELRVILRSSTTSVKARLMDQSRIAGLGNLLTDEILWRAGLDPARPANSMSPAQERRLLGAIQTTLTVLGERGGSHTGDLHVARTRGGRCPRDGAALDRRTVGGRTTYSCPRHQR